ncbi:MAG: ISAs1 family transposase [Bryobacteraceae bacterium]|nr:ISAs1 family transposase [Bryobacteraceae bacterium]
MILLSALPPLMAAMSRITDPRQRRGVRHPFSSILALTVLGLVCRINDFAGLQRWSARHWHLLRRPLGFLRHRPPHATTMSRTLAKFSLAEFQAAFGEWLQAIVSMPGTLVVAVDGKTSKQGLDSQGHPIHMLNAFAQDLKVCLGQWPLDGKKRSEPDVLKAHLSELFDKYPALRLITGDALFAQRNLAELIVASGHNYLFQIKANQSDILDAAQTCFEHAETHQPDACMQEKKRGAEKIVFFGSTWTTPIMSVTGWVLPVAACSCESIGKPRTKKGKRHEKPATSSPASIRPPRRRSNCSSTSAATGK